MFLRNLSNSFCGNESALFIPVRGENISFGSLPSKAFAAFSFDPADFFFTGLLVTSAVGTDDDWLAGTTFSGVGFATGAGFGSAFGSIFGSIVLDFAAAAAGAALPFAPLLLDACLLGFPAAATPFSCAAVAAPFAGATFVEVGFSADAAFAGAGLAFGAFAAGVGFAAVALFPFAVEADGGGVAVAFPFPAGVLAEPFTAGVAAALVAGFATVLLLPFADGLGASVFGFAAGFVAALGAAAGILGEGVGAALALVFTSAFVGGAADGFPAIAFFAAGFAADCVGVAGVLEAGLLPFVAVAAGSFGLLAAIAVPPK